MKEINYKFLPTEAAFDIILGEEDMKKKRKHLGVTDEELQLAGLIMRSTDV